VNHLVAAPVVLEVSLHLFDARVRQDVRDNENAATPRWLRPSSRIAAGCDPDRRSCRPRSARLKLAGEGRTGGAGARRRRHDHHRALRRWTGVHAAVTALLKAGVTRRTEAEKHNNAPRSASLGFEIPHSPRSRSLRAIRDPSTSRLIFDVSGRSSLSFCDGDFVLKSLGSHAQTLRARNVLNAVSRKRRQ
jgi:hypothetical protein